MEQVQSPERLRSGRCSKCRTPFWWTGAMETVPNCSCGHEHSLKEFDKELILPGDKRR